MAVANKLLATTGGPATVAVLATLQNIRQAAVVVATGNGQTALIQGACALDGQCRREFLRTIAVWSLIATASVGMALIVAPAAFARWTGLPDGGEPLLAWMAIPVTVSVAFVYAAALLSALGQAGRVATVQTIVALVMACGAWPAARAARSGHLESLVLLLFATAAASVALALIALWRLRGTCREWIRGTGRWWSADALRRFLSVSGVLLITGCVAAASVVQVRSRILATQGVEVTGHFDAAWSISMNQVTLVLASLQTYALPSLAKARTGEACAAELSRLLLVAPLCAALTISVLALGKAQVLSLLYSEAFHPAEAYLRWTLLGDYLKVTSWILSMAMLAAADTRAFLLADLAAYGTFGFAAWALADRAGAAEGAAIAFVVMYGLHAGVCGWYVFRQSGRRISRSAIVAWAGGLAAVVGVSWWAWKIP